MQQSLKSKVEEEDHEYMGSGASSKHTTAREQIRSPSPRPEWNNTRYGPLGVSPHSFVVGRGKFLWEGDLPRVALGPSRTGPSLARKWNNTRYRPLGVCYCHVIPTGFQFGSLRSQETNT